MLLFKSPFRVISLLLCTLFVSNAWAIMVPVPLNRKVDESILIIVGTAGDTEVLYHKTGPARKIDDNHYIATTPIIDGFIYPIKVEEILLDRREAKERAGQKLLRVTVFHSRSSFGPALAEGEKYLIFLQRADIDTATVERYKLDKEEFYEASFDHAGVYELSGERISPERLERNLQYLRTTREILGIKNIEDGNGPLITLYRFLESVSEILKSSEQFGSYFHRCGF